MKAPPETLFLLLVPCISPTTDEKLSGASIHFRTFSQSIVLHLSLVTSHQSTGCHLTVVVSAITSVPLCSDAYLAPVCSLKPINDDTSSVLF